MLLRRKNDAYRRGFIATDDSILTTITEEAIVIEENVATSSYRRFFSIDDGLGPAIEMTDRETAAAAAVPMPDIDDVSTLDTDYAYPPDVMYASRWRNASFVDDSNHERGSISSTAIALRLDLVETRSIGNENGCDSTTVPISEIHYF